MFKHSVAKLSVCSVETIPVSVHYYTVCLESQCNVSFCFVVVFNPLHEEECFVSINLENITVKNPGFRLHDRLWRKDSGNRES